MSDYRHEDLVHQRSGRYNRRLIKAKARERALALSDTGKPSADEVRESLTFFQDIADIVWRRWRRDRGLPIESVSVDVPDWGASGDSFNRRR